jgi:hypothetical protein
MRRSCAICSPAIRLLGAEQRPSTECVAQMRRGAQPLTQGYSYHPSRHSAGQPIVAGWAYQFIAQLNFVRESWTAPLDVERVRPAKDANEVAAKQVKVLLGRRSCCVYARSVRNPLG